MAPQVGVQLQSAALPPRLTVQDALELYSSFYEQPRPWRELLAELGIEDKAAVRVERLSGGERQRVFVALALVNHPRLAFLDELTTALDPQSRRNMWDTVEHIRDAGATVVLTTHYMEEAERLCDRVAIMDHGRLAALDTVANLIATHAGDTTTTILLSARHAPLALDATLPAFASLVLAMTGVLQLPVAMLTLRDTGALRRLSLTPLRPSTLIAASLSIHFVVSMVGMLAALALGIAVFGVSMPGNVPGVLAVCLIGLSSFLAVGCALAALYPSATAATGIGNGLMILLMLTSGAFTPLAMMPTTIQQIIRYSPVRWFVEAAQSAWNGDPMSSMIRPTLLLCVVLVVAALVGRWRFRWDPAP